MHPDPTAPRRDWHTARKAALARDGACCLFCAATAPLDVHHMDGIWSGRLVPDDRLSNLVTLCQRCHRRVHAECVRLTPAFLERVARIRAGEELLPTLPEPTIDGSRGRYAPASGNGYTRDWMPLSAFYVAHPEEREDA